MRPFGSDFSCTDSFGACFVPWAMNDPHADGSASLEQGQTQVLAIVHGPHEPTRRSEALYDKCIIECEFYRSRLSRASTRQKRRATDRASLEVSLALK